MTEATSARPGIAVTGATGGIGGRVSQLLSGRGISHRALVRDLSRAPSEPGTHPVRVDGYDDFDGMREALTGVRRLLLVPARESADRVTQHQTAVDAAVAAGVTHIVYVSFTRASPTSTFTFARDHYKTEQHIVGHGVAHTFLRDSLYQDLLPTFPGKDGVLRGPAGSGRFAPVARDDVAAVAAETLTEDGHEGRVYDVTGPERMTMSDVAADLTRASGRLITYDDETLDQAYASRAAYGAPDWEVAGWVTSYAAIAAGELDMTSTAVADITGREPMSFADFLSRHPESVAPYRT
jgi:NAD(P)H dehydrogenase (quinone)